MRTSPAGIALIHHFETCELEAYPDPGSQLGKACAAAKLPMRQYRKVPNYIALSGSPWTIGWGHTGNDVCPGLVWTQSYADKVFAADLLKRETGVESLLKVKVTQWQFDALVSFAYNVGLDIDADEIAEGLGDSTLLKLLNAGKPLQAAEEFRKWVKSKGQVMPGLITRRAAERLLFLGLDWRKAL